MAHPFGSAQQRKSVAARPGHERQYPRHPHDCGGIASVWQKKSSVDGCAPHLDESTSVGS
jgi:hypothetical protein